MNSVKFRQNVYEANSIRFSDGGNPNAKKIILRINDVERSFSCKKEAIVNVNIFLYKNWKIIMYNN